MLRNIKLGIRQSFSFGILVFITAVLGLTGWTSLGYVAKKVGFVDDQSRLTNYILEARRQEKNYLLHREQKYVEAVLAVYAKIKVCIDDTGMATKENNDFFRMFDGCKNAFTELVDLIHQQEAKKREIIKIARKAINESEELWREVKQIVEASKDFKELRNNVKILENRNRLANYLLELRRQEKNYLLRGEKRYVEAVNLVLSKINGLIKGKDLLLKDDKGFSLIIAAYQKKFEQLVDLTHQQESKEMIMVEFAREAAIASEALRKRASTDMNSTMASSRILMIILTTSSIILAVILAFFVTRSLTIPIKKGAVFAEKLANGNFTDKLDIDQNDEVGLLARSLNKIAVNFDQMLKRISSGVELLASLSKEISATTVQLAASASETTGSVSEITTTVEEVKQTVHVSNKKAGDVAEDAKRVARTSEDGKKVTKDAITGMKRIKQEMEYIAESIAKLSEQTQSVGKIVSAVNDLADQSNLLSVNAAIEAAKAGEHGKSFNIVAQEVKILAQQSKEATKQVRIILNDIQKAAGAAAMATERGGKAVETGMDLSARAGDAIKTLTINIKEATQAFTQVAASSQQQLIGMDQLAQAMESIKAASMENMESAKHLETTTLNLEELGQKMKTMAEQFTV